VQLTSPDNIIICTNCIWQLAIAAVVATDGLTLSNMLNDALTSCFAVARHDDLAVSVDVNNLFWDMRSTLNDVGMRWLLLWLLLWLADCRAK
jgi:hypothetical protein